MPQRRNKSRKIKSPKGLPKHLQHININAAGIDVGSDRHVLAVPEERDAVSVREFGTFTVDLQAIGDWLEKCGVTTIAMESTGVYWIPLFEVLEQRGFEVKLVDARHVKNVSGRKSDVLDCQWIQQLHTRGDLPAMPETEEEVRRIVAESYRLETSSVLIGSAAREETVKAQISKYHVLHFATHSVLDDRNPLYSYLLLTTDGRSNEDGLLEAWEIMGMELNVSMAVLSACDSARGRVGAGEGLIGMTWALFVAGVPTTVASQWAVPSNSTAKLMVAFHDNAKRLPKAGPSGKRLCR